MSNGQYRVLVLLIVLLALEAVVSQPVKAFASGAAHGKLDLSAFMQPGPGGKLPGPFVAYLSYGIGGLALIAFAAVAPDVATTLVLLLIVLVLVSHGTVYADALRGVGQTLGYIGVTAPTNGTQPGKK